MKACLSLLVVLLTLQTTAQENQIHESAIQISTPVGIVEGIAENKNVIAFKGIPFAKPPIGELRWKAPVPIEKWNGIRSAKHGCGHAVV